MTATQPSAPVAASASASAFVAGPGPVPGPGPGPVPSSAPTPAGHAVLGVAPAEPGAAAAYFAASLAFHTDVSDVAAALAAGGDPGFTLVDTRSTEAWDQGHIPGAVHLPAGLVAERAPALLERERPVVVHCWGPGCNGATRAALALAALGYRVKEMLGGIEYWIREGQPYETAAGPAQQPVDPRTAPVAAGDCGC